MLPVCCEQTLGQIHPFQGKIDDVTDEQLNPQHIIRELYTQVCTKIINKNEVSVSIDKFNNISLLILNIPFE